MPTKHSSRKPKSLLSYNSTRGGKNSMSSHALAENIRPWIGIKVKTFLDVPADCICTWAMHNGSVELKFVWKLCPVKGHAQ